MYENTDEKFVRKQTCTMHIFIEVLNIMLNMVLCIKYSILHPVRHKNKC